MPRHSQTHAMPISIAKASAIAAFIAAVCCGSSVAIAQQSDELQRVKPGELQSFEDISVERISPHELSEIAPGLGRSSIATAETVDLPRPLNRQEMDRLREVATSRTVLIIALIMPARPYRQEYMVYNGHATWVETQGAGPALITTADWLADAEHIFLVDDATQVALHKHGVALATEHRVGATRPSSQGIEGLFKNDRDVLIELRATRREPNLNLAHLEFVSEDAAVRTTPEAGWPLHDMSRPAPPMLFSYSPERSELIEPVQVLDARTLDEAYQFYIPNSSTAILGAPIFSNSGRLVALNALRHPERGTIGLAVPPGALSRFVESLSGD